MMRIHKPRPLGLVAHLVVTLSMLGASTAAAQAPFDIVAVEAPYKGTETDTSWQEVAFPADIEPFQNLVLLKKDGTKQTLVDCSSGCSVVDPAISFDGKRVYYSLYPDARPEGFNFQRNLPYQGADIYVMDLATLATRRLTNQEWTPNTQFAWAPDPLGAQGPGYRLGFGILNLGPFPFSGPEGEEWIVFTSSRDSFVPARGLTNPNLRLYIMNAVGRNVRPIGHLNVESAMHPVTLNDGRVMWTSGEAQGVRDGRNWGLWATKPDGRTFEPLMSSLTEATVFHFQTQLSDERISVTSYYNLNNKGFGSLLVFRNTHDPVLPNFGSPVANHPSNPAVQEGIWFFDPSHPAHLQPRFVHYPFSPPGLDNLARFTHHEDNASSQTVAGGYAGKLTHPSSAPNNGVLAIWSDRTPANDLNRPSATPRPHGTIVLIPNGVPIDDPSQLTVLYQSPTKNYQQPRAVVPWSAIYNKARPDYHPYLPDGATPFGIVGTASFYNRNTTPGKGNPKFAGLDSFNTSENGESTNWFEQGADAGLYANKDIYAVELLAMEGRTFLSYGPDGLGHERTGFSGVGETLRILAQIPLRKFDSQGNQPLDGDGNPDTSFKVRIPADVPFTFRTLDKNGMVLNMAQTWHQVRPGEVRVDCGGCHAHANRPSDINQTVAGKPDYQVWDAVDKLPMLVHDSAGNPSFVTYTGAERKTMMDVEYVRDIRPIIQRSCVQCHSGAAPAAKLDLNTAPTPNGFDQAYNCIALDTQAKCGYKPVIPAKVWRQTNASRFARPFQARRSLLVWKVWGQRLDGWKNEDHPTETVPGDASTLPPGATPNEADLDYNGVPCPPPGSGVPALSRSEQMLFARWVDLGMPSNRVDGKEAVSNLFVDELRPTLNISWPRMETVRDLGYLEFVAHDYYSGLNMGSLVVTTDFTVNGKPPGTNLGPDFVEADQGRFRLTLAEPITELADGTVTVKIADNAGNFVTQETLFHVHSTGSNPNPPPSPFPPGPELPPGPGPGPNPPSGPTDPNMPQPSDPIFFAVPPGPLNVQLGLRRGKIRPVSVKIPVVVMNVIMPPKTKVTLLAVGQGKKVMGMGVSKSKFDLRKARVKKFTAKFSKPGTYRAAFQLAYPGGAMLRWVDFVVSNPPGM